MGSKTHNATAHSGKCGIVRYPLYTNSLFSKILMEIIAEINNTNNAIPNSKTLHTAGGSVINKFIFPYLTNAGIVKGETIIIIIKNNFVFSYPI